MTRYLRWVVGGLLCAAAAAIFIISIPYGVKLVGPFLLASIGIWLIVGPNRIAAARNQRKSQFQSYLAATPDARATTANAKSLQYVGIAILFAAVVWTYFGPQVLGDANWIWVFVISGAIAACGLLLVVYYNVVTGIAEFRSRRGERK